VTLYSASMASQSYKFGQLKINPATNPAVLDTTTWNTEEAWKQIDALHGDDLIRAGRAEEEAQAFEIAAGVTIHPSSRVQSEEGTFVLATLPDKQDVLLHFASAAAPATVGEPIGRKELSDGTTLSAVATRNETIDRFARRYLPEKVTRALGATPRLGIGDRMSTTVFPAIWNAMQDYGFAANAIQNSLRELNMLEDLVAGKQPHTNYLFSFGKIDEGHTGSTFEGLWLAGMMSALKKPGPLTFGADADHIMVKRGPGGLERAKRVATSGRHYSFFTLDVSDVLDYGAINETSEAKSREYLETLIPTAAERNAVLAFHRDHKEVAGYEYEATEEALGRLVGKYWPALDAADGLGRHVASLKEGVPFDMELSIDENPAEVKTCDNLTKDIEVMFLLLEAERRELGITHIAPNFGVEKGVDYRCPAGREELEARVKRQYEMADSFGVMLDCHSGDDLSSETRKVFGRATGHRIHFKISPMLQNIYGRTLEDTYPEKFKIWWDDTVEYAKAQAESGAEIAIEGLKEIEKLGKPSARTGFFEHFCFATVGKRDREGQYLYRELFYTLPDDFYDEYTKRLTVYLGEVAADTLGVKA
jgi:hypothetical protein